MPCIDSVGKSDCICNIAAVTEITRQPGWPKVHPMDHGLRIGRWLLPPPDATESDFMTMTLDATRVRREAPLHTPTGLGAEARRDIGGGLAALLADSFALYLKTKNFHWHMSGPHFRDYHLMLDEQSDQIFAMTDPLAERARKLGGTTLRSIGDISRHQRLSDNDAVFVTPQDMLAELRQDNLRIVDFMRTTHVMCDGYGDVATASLLEVWIDEGERRAWFLFESGREG